MLSIAPEEGQTWPILQVSFAGTLREVTDMPKTVLSMRDTGGTTTQGIWVPELCSSTATPGQADMAERQFGAVARTELWNPDALGRRPSCVSH